VSGEEGEEEEEMPEGEEPPREEASGPCACGCGASPTAGCTARSRRGRPTSPATGCLDNKEDHIDISARLADCVRCSAAV